MLKAFVRIGTALLYALYSIARVLPGKREQFVCISRQSNTAPTDFRLISEFMSSHHPEYRVVILAKELHNPVPYAFHMLRQVCTIARSQAAILDSYCIAVSLLNKRIKAPVIQMWHAMGNMKKFGYTSIGGGEGRSLELAQTMHMHEGYDSVLISSMSFIDDYVAGFKITPEIVYEAPLPRTDLLIDPANRAAQRGRILERFPELAERRNIVYCPTFRRTPAPNEKEAMRALVDAVDFDRYNLIYKPHPVSTQRIEDERVLQDYPKDLDMLYVADYVISDYSTVIYEAGLLDVPVYLYAYDWDTYSGRRGLNIDIEHDVPTLFTASAEEILQAIEHDEFDHEVYQAFTRDNIAIHPSTTCTERIINHVLEMIGER